MGFPLAGPVAGTATDTWVKSVGSITGALATVILVIGTYVRCARVDVHHLGGTGRPAPGGNVKIKRDLHNKITVLYGQTQPRVYTRWSAIFGKPYKGTVTRYLYPLWLSPYLLSPACVAPHEGRAKGALLPRATHALQRDTERPK